MYWLGLLDFIYQSCCVQRPRHGGFAVGTFVAFDSLINQSFYRTVKRNNRRVLTLFFRFPSQFAIYLSCLSTELTGILPELFNLFQLIYWSVPHVRQWLFVRSYEVLEPRPIRPDCTVSIADRLLLRIRVGQLFGFRLDIDMRLVVYPLICQSVLLRAISHRFHRGGWDVEYLQRTFPPRERFVPFCAVWPLPHIVAGIACICTNLIKLIVGVCLMTYSLAYVFFTYYHCDGRHCVGSLYIWGSCRDSWSEGYCLEYGCAMNWSCPLLEVTNWLAWDLRLRRNFWRKAEKFYARFVKFNVCFPALNCLICF